jgi:hypothetical protein
MLVALCDFTPASYREVRDLPFVLAGPAAVNAAPAAAGSKGEKNKRTEPRTRLDSTQRRKKKIIIKKESKL